MLCLTNIIIESYKGMSMVNVKKEEKFLKDKEKTGCTREIEGRSGQALVLNGQSLSINE